MYHRRDHLTRTARAPAKLNLYLEILGRRDDGFHELETLMVPIRLGDSLRMTSLPPFADGQPSEIVLNVRAGLPLAPPRQPWDISAGDDNLVVRALKLLRDRSNCRLGARIDLVKRIPAQAGLGGGSSDAAAALRLANRVWELDWPPDRLAELAVELGSDVAFFLAVGAAICRGRGERVERVECMRSLHFVVVKPPEDLSTADVYRAHDAPEMAHGPESGRLNRIAETLVAGRRDELGRWMHNRLQSAAALLSPCIERLRTAFDRLDCLGHQLSGSGSAYFGVCRHAQHARRLAGILRTRQLGLVFATRSCG